MMTKSLAGWRKIHLCRLMITASLLLGAAGFAGCIPACAAEPQQNIEVLLQNVEQRVSENHTMSPQGDSALDAWEQVMTVVPSTDPARLDKALTDFASHMRQRADEEKKAGKTPVAEEFSLFASQAEGLKAHILGTATAAAPPTAGLPSADPEKTLPSPKFEPLAGSLPVPAAPSVPGNPVPPPPLPPNLSPTIAEFYAWCGDQMLSAARKYYEYAAKAGSARASAQLTKINEPAVTPAPPPEPKPRPQVHHYYRHPHPRPTPAPEDDSADPSMSEQY